MPVRLEISSRIMRMNVDDIGARGIRGRLVLKSRGGKEADASPLSSLRSAGTAAANHGFVYRSSYALPAISEFNFPPS